MKKKFFKIIGLALAATLFVGCGSKSADNGGQSAGNNDKLIVYSNAVGQGRGDFIKEYMKGKGIDIEVVDLGGNALSNRLIAEKGSPIADVVFGLNEMVFRQIESQADGIWKEYEPAWKDKLDPNTIPEGGRFYPFNEARVFMVYDKNRTKDPVKDWVDISNREDLKEKYLVPDSLSGQTSNAILYNILTNYVDKNGDLNISEEGWKTLEKYFNNGAVTTEGQTPGGELVNGRVDYIYTWLSNVPILEKEFNVSLGVVNPPYGVPQTFEQIGIINKKNVKAKAQEFVDLLGGEELMSQMAEKFGYVPANKDAQSKINSRVKEILDQTVPQKNDFKFIGENIESWVEKVELNYLGK